MTADEFRAMMRQQAFQQYTTESHCVRRMSVRILFIGLLACCLGCEQRAKPVHVVHGARKQNPDSPSLHFFLSGKEAKQFRPGQPLAEALENVQWRGNFLMSGTTTHGDTTSIAYQLFSVDPHGEGGETVNAIFVNDKFVKFVPWLRGDMIDVDHDGTKWSRPKPIKMGDVTYLGRLADSNAIDLTELEKEVALRAPTPSQVDPGLTVAFLILRATVLQGSKFVATDEDYRRNTILRDQFNPMRLKLGMSNAEIQKVFRAKPLESGKAATGAYEIYGSNESFNIMYPIHFSNVLVHYSDGKAAAIYAADSGDSWRDELAWHFSDLNSVE